MNAPKLTVAQIRMLESIREYGNCTARLVGKAEFGGAEGTRAVLVRLGLVHRDRDELTSRGLTLLAIRAEFGPIREAIFAEINFGPGLEERAIDFIQANEYGGKEWDADGNVVHVCLDCGAQKGNAHSPEECETFAILRAAGRRR